VKLYFFKVHNFRQQTNLCAHFFRESVAR